MHTASASRTTTRTWVVDARTVLAAGNDVVTGGIRPDGVLTGRQHVEQRLGRFRYDRTIVLAQQRRDRGGDLRLRDAHHVMALAERRRIRTNNGNPDVFRSLLIDPVFLPLLR